MNNVGLTVIFAILFFCHCGKLEKHEIRAPGIVEGEIITLKIKIAGTVEKLDVDEGERVEEGKIIVQVNNDKAKNQFKGLTITLKEIEINRLKLFKKLGVVKENIKYFRKQVNRFKRLKKSNSIPGEKLENMELKLMEAENSNFDLNRSLEVLEVQKERIQNKMEYVKLVLKDHVIQSPVQGLVLEKFVSQGENVFPNTAIVDILDTSNLYIEVFIEEEEMAKLSFNQRVAIHMDGLKGKKLSGKITYFGKKAEFSPKYIISEKERKALLYQVKIKVDPGDVDQYKIGLPVTVTFLSRQES